MNNNEQVLLTYMQEKYSAGIPWWDIANEIFKEDYQAGVRQAIVETEPEQELQVLREFAEWAIEEGEISKLCKGG